MREQKGRVIDGGCCEVDNCVVGVVGGKTYLNQYHYMYITHDHGSMHTTTTT